MQGSIQRVVLLPRYTAFHGATSFYTVGMNARAFAQILLTVWRGEEIGTGLSFSVQLQQSTDLRLWHDVGSPLAPNAGEEAANLLDLKLEWVRLVVTLSGVGAAVTTWAVGEFVPRDGVDA